MGKRWKLDGSWNDVSDLHNWLLSMLHWPEKSFRVLSDDLGDEVQPTRDNILKHLEWLFADAQISRTACKNERANCSHPKGCRLFHFCGHGGNDELYPLDWRTNGAITGEHLAQIVAR